MLDKHQPPDGQLQVLLAEDHYLLRKVTRETIGSTYNNVKFHEADTVAALIDLVKSVSFDLIILDIFLVDGNTVVQLQNIRAMQPNARILFFTMCPEEVYARRLLNNGADGFLNKRATEEEVCEALSRLMAGEKYMSRDLQRMLMLELLQNKNSNPFDRLSMREFEVMLLLLDGRQLNQISEDIGLQVTTISTYKTRILEKMDVTSIVELTRVAAAYGIIAI